MNIYSCCALLVLALVPADTATTPSPTPAPTPNSTQAPSASPDSTTATHTLSSTISNTSDTKSDTNNTDTTITPDKTTPDTNTTITSDPTTNITSNTSTTITPDTTTNITISDTTTTITPDTTTNITTTDTTTTITPDTTTNITTSDTTTTITPDTTTNITTSDTTTTTTTTMAPANTNVVISETNLLLASKDFFIELQVDKSDSLNGWNLVIYNGTDGRTVQDYNNSTLTLYPTTGIAIQRVAMGRVQNLTSVAVVLYPPGVNTSQVKNAQDFVGYATGDGTLAANLIETILPHRAPLPVVKSHNNLTLSMTRSGNKPKDNSAFVMAPATRNQTNNDMLSLKGSATLQLRGNGCNDVVNDTDLRNTLVGEVNKLCQCGMSTMQIVGNITCQKDLFYNFSISQSYEGQFGEFVTSFQKYVSSNNTGKWRLNEKNFSVVNCTQQCWHTGHHLPPPTDSKSGNIKVTVAVVLSCIVVFLLILVAVIFYMRSKRRGIMRQFRMTRLQEDDDMDDMDNFMGAIDQEPDFSSSRNNLTN